MKVNCPACHRPLFSRKRITCGYCGAKIPSELRLSRDEAAAVQKEIDDIKMRREVAKVAEEKMQKQKRRVPVSAPSSQGAFILGLPPYPPPG